MPGSELEESRVRSDASVLHVGRSGEILGADEVRGGLVLPGDLAGWLTEGFEGLTGQTVHRLLGRGLIAVLEEELPDQVGIDGDGAIVAWLQPRRRLGADEVGLGLPSAGHHRAHVQQLGHAVISARLGDDHPAVGVTAEHDGAVDRGDRLPARIDVAVEVAEIIAGFAATRQRQSDSRDPEIYERLRHPAPPPGGVADACAVNEDQSRHREARGVLGRSGEPLSVAPTSAATAGAGSATAWLLRDGENCLLTRPLTTMVALRLGELVEDPELRARIARAGLQEVRGYRWDEQIERVWRSMCLQETGFELRGDRVRSASPV